MIWIFIVVFSDCFGYQNSQKLCIAPSAKKAFFKLGVSLSTVLSEIDLTISLLLQSTCPILFFPTTTMFKKFSSEEVSAQNQVKASVQRRIRQSIADEYPGLEPVMDDLLPKKVPLIVAKCQNHLNLVLVNNVPLFFNIRDGPYMPTLRLLHQYPTIMKKLQVDRGAIKFVLAGANIMCPGLTSPGGALDDEVEAETPVAIMAEGKQNALAIGFTKMSAKDIKTINKGIGVDNMHYLNDGLWKMERLD
ncbi:hypothetical protein LWI29_019883 [Acer saccharum]|uniref:PUA domain-containing protein n=1 Tax=Acer saccharum TaxID=4024 RepID=A0AA39SBH7_ACESA|nr:hypothetical protein LWI29_019883 [Acer saccharum]